MPAVLGDVIRRLQIKTGRSTSNIHTWGRTVQKVASLQRNLGSMFVIAAFLDRFSGGLAGNISMTIGLSDAPKPSIYIHSANAAAPLASILRAVHYVCSECLVTDEGSLAAMLENVRLQFGVVDECNETDRALALHCLEHVFTVASWAAQETLKEVAGGFQASGGDFAVWKEELLRRRCP